MDKAFVASVIFCLVSLVNLDCFSQQTDLRTLDETGLKTTFSQDDSAKAVINLFYRKRKGAMWRGIIGGGLVVYATVGATEDKFPGSFFVGPILFSPLWVTSLTSLAKYKQKNLLTLLHNRENDGAIPLKYRRKLRKKDFRS